MVGVLQCANSKAARLSLLSARELLRSDSEVRGGGSITSAEAVVAWFAAGGAAGSMVGVLQCTNSKAARLSLLSARASAIRVRGGDLIIILSYLIRVHYKGSLKGFTHSVTQGPRPGLMRVPLPRAPPRHFAHAAAPRRAVVLLGYLVSCRPKPAQRPRRAGSRDGSGGARNARSSEPAASRGDEGPEPREAT